MFRTMPSYAYSGLEAHLLIRDKDLEVVIPKPYQDIVVRGFTALGPSVYEAYGLHTYFGSTARPGMITGFWIGDPELQG